MAHAFAVCLQVANHDDFWKQIDFKGKQVLPTHVSRLYSSTGWLHGVLAMAAMHMEYQHQFTC